MNRREFLAGTSAVALAAAMPVMAAPGFVGLDLARGPDLVAWAVGTQGEYDWAWHLAPDERTARLAWVADFVGDDRCESGGDPKDDCDCDVCCNFRSADAQRIPEWDGKKVKPPDWLAVGMGHLCSRCGHETSREDGGHAVADEVVCEDCMKLADWDVVDPERAAEMRAELADEEEETNAAA